LTSLSAIAASSNFPPALDGSPDGDADWRRRRAMVVAELIERVERKVEYYAGAR
jgi:hypothetical protein